MSWLLSSREGLLTLAFFLGFLGAGLVETLVPRRTPAPDLGRRWSTNLGFAALNATLAALLLPRLVVPVFPAAESFWAAIAALHGAIALAIGVLLLDLIRYWIHRAVHAVPVLWRAHAIHHADHDLDVTTSYRHHPLEYALVAVTLSAAHGVLGIPAPALALYAGVTLLLTPLVHANVPTIPWLERVLAPAFVTPLLHARHHSRTRAESDTNYGMVFSFWDRLFGTAHRGDANGAGPAAFGIDAVDARRSGNLGAMLALPLSRRAFENAPPSTN